MVKRPKLVAAAGWILAVGLFSSIVRGAELLATEALPTSTPGEAKRLLCLRLLPGDPSDVRDEDDGKLSIVLWFRVTNDIFRCAAGAYESPVQIAPTVALDSAPVGLELVAPVGSCRPGAEMPYNGYYGWCLHFPLSAQLTKWSQVSTRTSSAPTSSSNHCRM
jgi:hypothetical protein